MLSRHFVRFFHNNSVFWNSVNKSDLSKLRKKTGYTFANCKKALELNPDIEQAEKWLKDQAQALGWAKAAKLQGRSTVQGLIGVALKGNSAVMLEINCETDFVGRNKKFKSLVELSTESCLTQVSKMESNSFLSKVVIESEELKTIPAPGGKTLADITALAISELGENINLRRALFLNSSENIHLKAYAHPSEDVQSSKVMMGKYGAVVAYSGDFSDPQTQQVARQLCQHIVGMNPKKLGIIGEDEPSTKTDEEDIMLHQEFLLDPELTVGEFISNIDLKIIDFARFECGEVLDNSEASLPLRASG